jgi:hypothetical protein
MNMELLIIFVDLNPKGPNHVKDNSPAFQWKSPGTPEQGPHVVWQVEPP